MRSDFFYFGILTVLGMLVGCTGRKESDSAPAPSGAAHAAEDHGHPSIGPHHGAVVELGNEEYHAELLRDASSVTIYILDSSARNLVAVDAQVSINALHDGTPKQYSLDAQPEQSDTAGKSSRYVSTDSELAALMDDNSQAARLSILIDGVPYRGELQHDHDDHDHAEHADHDHKSKPDHDH